MPLTRGLCSSPHPYRSTGIAWSCFLQLSRCPRMSKSIWLLIYPIVYHAIDRQEYKHLLLHVRFRPLRSTLQRLFQPPHPSLTTRLHKARVNCGWYGSREERHSSLGREKGEDETNSSNRTRKCKPHNRKWPPNRPIIANSISNVCLFREVQGHQGPDQSELAPAYDAFVPDPGYRSHNIPRGAEQGSEKTMDVIYRGPPPRCNCPNLATVGLVSQSASAFFLVGPREGVCTYTSSFGHAGCAVDEAEQN